MGCCRQRGHHWRSGREDRRGQGTVVAGRWDTRHLSRGRSWFVISVSASPTGRKGLRAAVTEWGPLRARPDLFPVASNLILVQAQAGGPWCPGCHTQPCPRGAPPDSFSRDPAKSPTPPDASQGRTPQQGDHSQKVRPLRSCCHGNRHRPAPGCLCSPKRPSRAALRAGSVRPTLPTKATVLTSPP